MTIPSPIEQPTSTDPTTETSTKSKNTNATEHYSRRTNATPERRTRATRSRDSHRCITIRGWVPASGRSAARLRVINPIVDLRKINSAARWSPWC
jgi:hypothetical protein